MTAVFSLGSNLPFGGMESPAILRAACECLAEKLIGFRASSIYRTAPLYYRDQDDFYNLVCKGEFRDEALTETRRHSERKYKNLPTPCPCASVRALLAENLLAWTQGIEARFGRDRTREIPKGPRSLDIDIVLLGNTVVSTQKLIIPHPKARERAFVLVPMLEILPDSADPISGEKYRMFLDRLDTTGVKLIHEI